MKNNTIKIVLIIIVLAIVLALIISMGPGNGNNKEATPSPQASPSEEAGTNNTALPPAAEKPSRPAKQSQTSGITYEEALKQFANARFQFDMNCQATPQRRVITNGTNIMLDNRSGDARWISLDGFAYQIPGLGFKIVPVKVASTPHTVILGCGSAVNVASILVQ